MKLSLLRSSAIAAVTFGVVVLGSISGANAQQDKQKKAVKKPVAVETVQPPAGETGVETLTPVKTEGAPSEAAVPAVETTKTESKKVATKTATAPAAAPAGPSRSFTATAYALRGRMANGAPVHRGAIAADTRVLPMGTRVYISAGSLSGEYVVKDTGGAVKGRRIDIWVPSHGQAIGFGRRSVQLTVLSGRRATSGATKATTAPKATKKAAK